MIVCNKKSPAPIDTEHSSLTTNPSLWPAKRSKAERRNAGYTPLISQWKQLAQLHALMKTQVEQTEREWRLFWSKRLVCCCCP